MAKSGSSLQNEILKQSFSNNYTTSTTSGYYLNTTTGYTGGSYTYENPGPYSWRDEPKKPQTILEWLDAQVEATCALAREKPTWI